MSKPSQLDLPSASQPSQDADGAIDHALIARWLGGEERAATLLVERHAAALSRFGASLTGGGGGGGGGGEVEELVQDTFVRAFQSLADFRGDCSLRTWLFTIERRLLVDRRRADGRRIDRDEIGERDAATEYTPLDAIVAEETEERIGRALKELSPMQREVFTLRVAEGLSYREIAGVVGTTEGAARVHYHNAVRTIKELVDA